MNEEALRVSAWGFSADELVTWPPGFTPLPVTQGPFEGAVLVHARAAAGFVAEAAAHPLADGRLAPAVLYATGDVLPAPGVLVDFAATVNELDAGQLTELLGCPEHFAMAEYAEELPADYLRRLTRPIAEVAAQELPLPAEVTAHLAACPTCRAAFDGAVAARRHWQRLVFCPSPAQLHAYLSGVDLSAVAQHVAECPHCRAEAAVLGRTMQPAWLTVSLRSAKSTLAAAAHSFTALPQSLLVTMLNGLLAQMQTAGAQALRRPAASAAGEGDVAALVNDLLQGRNVKLVREHRDLTLHMTPDQTAIVISGLHGEDKAALADFQVELWSEDDLHWSGRSRNGQLLLPLAALQTALRQSAAHLVVRPGVEEETIGEQHPGRT